MEQQTAESEGTTAEAPVNVGLATGPELAGVTRAALAALGLTDWAGAGELVVAAGPRPRRPVKETATAVAELARQVGGAPHLITPRHRIEDLKSWNRVGPDERWVRVDVADRAERLIDVLAPRQLVQAEPLIAVSTFDARGTARPPLALAFWPSFVHPRDALAVRLGGTRLNLAAEVALAFTPRLYLLAGTLGSRRAVVATADPIAADLVGLALWQERLGPQAEVIGPWEDPLVQHATELGLGVRSPDQIRLIPRWTGPPELRADTLDPLLNRIATRLGLEKPARETASERHGAEQPASPGETPPSAGGPLV